jgi:phosphopantetheine adenylyltransferase
MGDKDKVVLFSGRFDPPHPGHIAQVMRLLSTYARVKVVVLDYPDRRFPHTYVKHVFDEVLNTSKWPIDIVTNKTHFAKITLEELKSFECDIYAAGNMEVLKHIEQLGFPCIYVERAFDYSASKYQST